MNIVSALKYTAICVAHVGLGCVEKGAGIVGRTAIVAANVLGGTLAFDSYFYRSIRVNEQTCNYGYQPTGIEMGTLRVFGSDKDELCRTLTHQEDELRLYELIGGMVFVMCSPIIFYFCYGVSDEAARLKARLYHT